MPAAFAALQAWLAAAGGDAIRVALSQATATSAERGLVTAVAVDAGATLVRVPLAAALTPAAALRDPGVQALLGGDLKRLKAVLAGGDVPHASILVLALVLLADAARGAGAPRAPYVKLLPAPPESAFARAACEGPAATDVTLFTDDQLDSLACAPFADAVRAERARLGRVWAALFHDADAVVSLPSFLWAHALVRSRALDLRLVGVDVAAPAALERVLLPVIDLAQHGTRADGAAVLRLVVDADRRPTAVDLVATTPLPAHAPICLDYGARPLRDLLRGYGFVPQLPLTAPVSEIFEDVACVAPGRALVIDASDGLTALSLAHVRVLAEPGGDAALETTAARVVWCVARPRAGAAVTVGPDDVETDMAPEDEAAAARAVAAACRELARLIEGGGEKADATDTWLAREHARLGAAYRAARRALLLAAADGAEAQAARLG